MRPLVRLRTRSSRDGEKFKYFLDYKDENGKRRQISLGHADGREAKRQRDQKERELRTGITVPQSMRLNTFLEDSERRSRGQVCESTLVERSIAMRHLIEAIGDIDYLRVEYHHGERFVQACFGYRKFSVHHQQEDWWHKAGLSAGSGTRPVGE